MCILDSRGYKVSSCRLQRRLSVCMDAQADLSLNWKHTSEGVFSNVAANIIPGDPFVTLLIENEQEST